MRKLLSAAVLALITAGLTTACTDEYPFELGTPPQTSSGPVEESRDGDSSGLTAPQNDVPPATPTATSPAPQRRVQALSAPQKKTVVKEQVDAAGDEKTKKPASQVVDQPEQAPAVDVKEEVAGPKNSSALPSSPEGLKPGDRWMDSAGTEHLVYVPEEQSCQTNGTVKSCSGAQYAPVPPAP